MNYIRAISGDIFAYDARIFDYDWEPKEDMIKDVFNKSAKVNELF